MVWHVITVPTYQPNNTLFRIPSDIYDDNDKSLTILDRVIQLGCWRVSSWLSVQIEMSIKTFFYIKIFYIGK